GNVLTTDRDKIGSVGQVYADDDSGQPTWVTAKTGLFGTSESFVPLDGARVEGGDVLVPYTKDQVKDAPRVDTDGHLDPAEEDRLYAHYGLSGG
ncbi:PRC-barrel domain-containing protein, partial [Campylobacter coli]|uniref:PRC-barrel domain-containing protein n=1 Tax=Campylobacter coli TaxID=195 RepID=UPI003CF5D6F9